MELVRNLDGFQKLVHHFKILFTILYITVLLYHLCAHFDKHYQNGQLRITCKDTKICTLYCARSGFLRTNPLNKAHPPKFLSESIRSKCFKDLSHLTSLSKFCPLNVDHSIFLESIWAYDDCENPKQLSQLWDERRSQVSRLSHLAPPGPPKPTHLAQIKPRCHRGDWTRLE